METTMPARRTATTRSTRRYRPPEHVRELSVEQYHLFATAKEKLKAPGTLYTAGNAGLLGMPRVAIVGSRGASDEGLRRARKLARQLVQRGVVVVSGLAAGIDAAAHRAAIEAEGSTIAVIGTPLDKAYPAENSELQELIYERHLLVSQFRIGEKTYPSAFVARNRVMAMLSHASVIVEAGDGSGTLSQAYETQSLKRPLFILRSMANDESLLWPKRFLDAGAEVLDDVAQIFDAIGV